MMKKLQMGPHINDMSTAEIVDELHRRIRLTNGLDFCSDKKLQGLVTKLLKYLWTTVNLSSSKY